ncbi:MAG TPA: hypothetical protein VLM37_12540, partial [Fibrobacteraceae bacterium]|nr:hypothetical protein [Fibrobacteraceae bacterium]
ESDASAMDFSLGVGWGFEAWRERLWLGFRGNWLHSQLDDVPGDGYALDLGASWNFPMRVKGSLAIQNIAHGFTYRSGTETLEKLPTLVRLGIGFADSTSPWGWQIAYTKSNDAEQRLHAGGEWNWRHILFTRLGYEYDIHDPELGWMRGLAAGLGVQLNTLGLEYAVRSLGDLGLEHTLTVQVHPPLPHSEEVDYLRLAREQWEHGTCTQAEDFAHKALRRDPSDLDALAILQACAKEARMDHGEYLALAFTGNTEGQVLAFWDQENLVGGLSRRKTVLDQLHVQYPALIRLDAGRLFSGDTADTNQARLVELYAQLPVDHILESRMDSSWIQRGHWEKALPWLPAVSWLKSGQREVAVFAFSRPTGKENLQGILQKIQETRASWKRQPAAQIMLWDGTSTAADSLVRMTSGLDLVVLSGTNSLLERPLHVRDTWVLCPGRRGEAVSLAIAWFNQDGSLDWEFRTLHVNESIRPDSSFAEKLGEERLATPRENQAVIPQQDRDYLFLQTVEANRQDVWIADHQRARAARLTRSPARIRDAQMAWSRQKFFFLVDSGNGNTRLYLQSTQEKTPHLLPDTSGLILSAAWEPYENWIYYIKSLSLTRQDLFRTTWDGTHPMNLSQGHHGKIQEFNISPDGRSLAIISDSAGRTRLFVSNLTLGHRQAITPPEQETHLPRFSPDGTNLAYLARAAGDTTWDLMLWSPYNDQIQTLATGRDIHDLQWSEEGHGLYLETGINLRNLSVLDVQSGEEHPLRSSLDFQGEDTHPHPQRWQGRPGILFQSNQDGNRRILWISSNGDTLLEPIITGVDAWLP